MINIGLVVEGKHDRIILEELILKEIGDVCGGVKFTCIHPEIDEAGDVGSGGWQKVISWCVRNSGDDIKTYFKPLFAGQQHCDAIVVHVDGDSYADVMAFSKLNITQPPLSPLTRVNEIGVALRKSLATPGEMDKMIVFAIPVLHTEAWLVAAECIIHNTESMDAKSDFRRHFSRDIHGSLDKFYKLRAREAAKNSQLIEKQSESYKNFKDQLCSTPAVAA